jgi:hypothetical protein
VGISSFYAFISEDPIRFKGGINLYSYVENNPVNHKDLYGLCPNKICDGTWEGEAGYSTFAGVGCVCYWSCTNWGNSIHKPDPHITYGTVVASGEIPGDDGYCACDDPDGNPHSLLL